MKSLTGQDTSSKQEWCHQFLSDVITSPAELATQISNVFFTSTTQEFEHQINFACFLRRGFI